MDKPVKIFAFYGGNKDNLLLNDYSFLVPSWTESFAGRLDNIRACKSSRFREGHVRSRRNVDIVQLCLSEKEINTPITLLEEMYASPEPSLPLIHTKSLVLSMWECEKTATTQIKVRSSISSVLQT